MAYIAFASAKGSPGVTTAVAALAATWPADRPLVLVELDPAGGDLVVRLDLATEPGLVTLAAAGRRELDAETLLAHTQPLPALQIDDGASRRVLVAPVAAEQALASLSALRGVLAGVLDAVDADVLVDCGRVDPSSPVAEVAANADVLVAVSRPVVAEVHHLSARLASLKPRSASLLTVGDHPYSAAEVADAVGASALGTLPADERAAVVLAGGQPDVVRQLRRSRLLRDARSVAEALAGWLSPAGASAPGLPATSPVSPSPSGGPRRPGGVRSAAPPPFRPDLPPPDPADAPAPADVPPPPPADGRRRLRADGRPKHLRRSAVELEEPRR